MSSVIETDPTMNKLEMVYQILLKAEQARNITARRIVSSKVADLVAAVRLGNVSDKQLTAFSKLVSKIEKMKRWAKNNKEVQDKLDAYIVDVANTLVLQAMKGEGAMDRQLAQSISDVIQTPREEYIPPEPEMAEEIPIERPVPKPPKPIPKPEGAVSE